MEIRRSCDFLVCPKPRRVSIRHQIRPTSCLVLINQQQAGLADSVAANDLLDKILSKGGYGGELPNINHVASSSSPPYFSGSPPSRASNPLIEDAEFKEHLAAVRIEGFDCLNRDRSRRCSVSAVA